MIRPKVRDIWQYKTKPSVKAHIQKNSKSHVYFLQLNIFGEVCPKCEELPYFLERYAYQGPANAAVEDIFSFNKGNLNDSKHEELKKLYSTLKNAN